MPEQLSIEPPKKETRSSEGEILTGTILRPGSKKDTPRQEEQQSAPTVIAGEVIDSTYKEPPETLAEDNVPNIVSEDPEVDRPESFTTADTGIDEEGRAEQYARTWELSDDGRYHETARRKMNTNTGDNYVFNDLRIDPDTLTSAWQREGLRPPAEILSFATMTPDNFANLLQKMKREAGLEVSEEGQEVQDMDLTTAEKFVVKAVLEYASDLLREVRQSEQGASVKGAVLFSEETERAFVKDHMADMPITPENEAFSRLTPPERKEAVHSAFTKLRQSAMRELYDLAA